jgi:hypothetical protein
VLILGLVLLILGWITNIGILVTLGIILLIIGAVLWILGSMGAPGRRPSTLLVAPTDTDDWSDDDVVRPSHIAAPHEHTRAYFSRC